MYEFPLENLDPSYENLSLKKGPRGNLVLDTQIWKYTNVMI
jgi:hypothetical protein